MNYRSKRAIIGLGIILILLSVVLIIKSVGKTEPQFYKKFVNAQNSSVDGTHVNFYSGSFFATYDLKDHSVQKLSDYLIIKNGIANVSWAKNSVIFQTNAGEGDRDDITTAAQQLGMNPHSTHWWEYDFSAKQYKLLSFDGIDDCTTIAKINDAYACSAFAASSTTNPYQVRLYTIGNPEAKVLANSDDVINALKTDHSSNIYYISTSLSGEQSLNKVNVNSTKKTTIFRSEGSVTYTVNSRSLLLDYTSVKQKQTSKDTSSIEVGTPVATKHTIEIRSDNKVIAKKKIKTATVNLYVSDDTRPGFTTSNGDAYTYVNNELQLIGSYKPVTFSGNSVLVSDGLIYIVSGNTIYSPEKQHYGALDSTHFNIAKDNDPSGNSFIDQAQNGINDTYLYQPSIASSQQQEQIGTYLLSKNFEPAEFQFNWIVDGADFNVPIIPKAIRVE